ncbi:MAG: hypothetical protein ACAH06_10300 [Methylophilaceae bacterium]|uniref:hypothetical protein n=1 Tax=Methylobacillus sp. MM3 TaxID=1848039 RepID=UPI0013F4C989|nr:hypothetical protein [Methylobacillus sp. MM3]
MSGNGVSLFGGTLDAGAAFGDMTGGDALSFRGIADFADTLDAGKSIFGAIFGGALA